MLAVAPTARANPHAVLGVPDSVCSVVGVINPPLMPIFPPAPSSYAITQQNALCTGGNKAGVYVVDLWGRETDPFHSNIGATVFQGGSKSFLKDQPGATGFGNTEYHTGKLHAVHQTADHELWGKLHHVRLGALWAFDGPVWTDANRPDTNDAKKQTKPDQWVQGVLIAVPIPPTFTQSQVAGTMLISENADTLAHVCGLELAGPGNHPTCPGIALLPPTKNKSGDHNGDGDNTDPGDCPKKEKDWTEPSGFPVPCAQP